MPTHDCAALLRDVETNVCRQSEGPGRWWWRRKEQLVGDVVDMVDGQLAPEVDARRTPSPVNAGARAEGDVVLQRVDEPRW